MSATATTIQNRTAALNPEIVCHHVDDVASVRPLPDFRLDVRFVDGTQGIVDLSGLIQRADAGVFSALAEEALFQKVEVVYGAVTWPNGLDLAPDAMYSALRTAGVWKL